MNENIPATPRTKIPRGQILRSCIATAGFCLLLVSLLFAANTKPREKSKSATHASTADNPPRVLMIGDSLTVGPFGGAIYRWLVDRFGASNVAVFGSCGSSPEHWLHDPGFATPCGFREDSFVREGGRGRRTHYETPRLDSLVAKFHPTIVIIQLGTNWMDFVARKTAGKHPDYEAAIDRLVSAARSGNRARPVIWITPPDSSHFTKNTQRVVENFIMNAAERDDFRLVRSRPITHYSLGRTGSDGIHYNDAAGGDWARKVSGQLADIILPTTR